MFEWRIGDFSIVRLKENFLSPKVSMWTFVFLLHFIQGCCTFIRIVETVKDIHCVKIVRIRSYSGLYFTAFTLNTERYGVSLSIQFECGKIQTRITPNTDNFYAVIMVSRFNVIQCLQQIPSFTRIFFFFY